MAYENLLYEKKDGIAYITFNRPKVLNALNRKTVEELQHACWMHANDQAVTCFDPYGRGRKGLCSGADITSWRCRHPSAARNFPLFGQSVFSLLETMGKPPSALSTDLRWAADASWRYRARFES